MNVGILGSSKLAVAVTRALANVHRVHVISHEHGGELADVSVAPVADLAELARNCRVLLVCAASGGASLWQQGDGADLSAELSSGTIVVDLTAGDPEQARGAAASLQQRGVSFIDAPLHCEMYSALPDTAAITCGGLAEAVDSVRPVLEAICPKVIHFGEAGNGRAAGLVIATVAAANRMVTYETAAMGFRNGLSVEDMGTVLTRCSGNNSGTVRVLPAIATGSKTADVSLRSVVADLTASSQMAARVGAPMLIGNLLRSLLQAESNRLGTAAGLDDTFSFFHEAARTALPRTEAAH